MTSNWPGQLLGTALVTFIQVLIKYLCLQINVHEIGFDNDTSLCAFYKMSDGQAPEDYRPEKRLQPVTLRLGCLIELQSQPQPFQGQYQISIDAAGNASSTSDKSPNHLLK
jgi:hypothetical protein